MPDIAVDYELLNQVAQKARNLKEQVQHAREGKQDYTTNEVGAATVSTAIRAYYSVWKSSFKRSEEKLEKLGNLYEGVARGWADWDFRLAGEASKQEASLAADLYSTQKKIWDDWQQQVHDGNADPNDPHAPKPPQDADRPGTWTTDDGHGNTTTTTYEYGADGKPTKITTTLHTNTGLTSTDTTNYHADGTYDSKATDVYGNVTSTTGNSQTTESGNHKNTNDTFNTTTKGTDGKVSTTTGTTTSVYDKTTGHRDSDTTYTTVGPDKDGNEETVHGTSHSSVDINGHEVVTTVEVKPDGSGTKTVVTDGRTEEWKSDQANQDTGWTTSSK
ncbi:hypothetical protein QMK19_19675 [Streptomyces sp. H10-C2]|uniref:hypothetical protein n=1 Tax=unclassified Streptomyces TaxID=2593676 RepID=UPI0024BBD865|nr:MULTISPECIES: hypothetical protein [unclassified Streptomyces]MDJ0343355.1 hypothetical protein [Streptomyces sp. PH10-H1]MDJ0371834.1 hypothetical protein [Streptomyces sp. H10-C2]